MGLGCEPSEGLIAQVGAEDLAHLFIGAQPPHAVAATADVAPLALEASLGVGYELSARFIAYHPQQLVTADQAAADDAFARGDDFRLGHDKP